MLQDGARGCCGQSSFAVPIAVAHAATAIDQNTLEFREVSLSDMGSDWSLALAGWSTYN